MNISREQYTRYHRIWINRQPLMFRLNFIGLYVTCMIVTASLVTLALRETEIGIAVWVAATTIYALTFLYRRSAARRFHRELQSAVVLLELIRRAMRHRKINRGE